MSYDALVITAHPDDAATQMGGRLAITASVRPGRLYLHFQPEATASPILLADPTAILPGVDG